jgi:hypothetical protein
MKSRQGDNNLDESREFPESYRELVSRHLQEKYGEKISIRSAIVYPPIQEKKMINGREIYSFTGKVRFNVVDRRDKDFGMHQLTYLIQNNQLVSIKEEP